MQVPAWIGLIAACLVAGCTQPTGLSGTETLAQPWMIGIERMQGDPLVQLPFTNRFIADLQAVPNTRVVFLGSPENNTLFNAWTGGRLRVAPWLRGERSCMTLTYTIFRSGQQQAVFGLIIPPPPAGTEPDSACVDRAAGLFYRALAVQGL